MHASITDDSVATLACKAFHDLDPIIELLNRVDDNDLVPCHETLTGCLPPGPRELVSVYWSYNFKYYSATLATMHNYCY